jgi:hypothetical protein
MSRKSTASLSVVPIGVPVRLAPPDDLTPEQALRWRAVVDSKPVDWFGPDSSPLLKEYVRAEAMCDLLAIQIEAAVVGGEPAVVKSVLQMRDMESKRLTSIATKLRLTQQSRYTPQAAATADRKSGSAGKPWQFQGN